MPQKIRPAQDRVAVSLVEEEQVTASGIVIPDTAKEKPMKGKVEAVGPGKFLDNGQVRPLSIKVGDIVLFGKYAGTEVKLGDNKWLIMREDDIMGVME